VHGKMSSCSVSAMTAETNRRIVSD
jgi:hypothetical protein